MIYSRWCSCCFIFRFIPLALTSKSWDAYEGEKSPKNANTRKASEINLSFMCFSTFLLWYIDCSFLVVYCIHFKDLPPPSLST